MSVGGGGGGKVKETELQKIRTDIGKKYYDDYTSRWRPARNTWMRRLQRNEGSDRQRVTSAAAGAVDVAFGRAADTATKTLQTRGVGIGGGASEAAAVGTQIDQAASRGLALTDADQAATDVQVGNQQAMVQVGRGNTANASAGLQTLANLSGAQAEQDAQIALNKNIATGELIGTGIGYAGAAAFGGGKPAGADALAGNGGAAGANRALSGVTGYDPNGFGG